MYNKSHAVEAASKSDMENKNMTLDCDSSMATTIGRERRSESEDCQQPLNDENMPMLKNGKSESLAESDQNCSAGVHDHGESSFSAAFGLLSSPIANSGSTSLRSNSSANSIRSFAFPVLPSEWNDSPVRMMEADRRHLRKRGRSWKSGFLCCKF